MGGSSALGNNGGQAGVYGALGTHAAGNTPGGRNGAASWTDNSGHLWLFGGWGYDANSNGGELNDLWKYQPSAISWPTVTPTVTVTPSSTSITAAQAIGLDLHLFTHRPPGVTDAAVEAYLRPMVEKAAFALSVNEAWTLLASVALIGLLLVPFAGKPRQIDANR